eukprot:3040792-Rhodomonas_salina.1
MFQTLSLANGRGRLGRKGTLRRSFWVIGPLKRCPPRPHGQRASRNQRQCRTAVQRAVQSARIAFDFAVRAKSNGRERRNQMREAQCPHSAYGTRVRMALISPAWLQRSRG